LKNGGGRVVLVAFFSPSYSSSGKSPQTERLGIIRLEDIPVIQPMALKGRKATQKSTH